MSVGGTVGGPGRQHSGQKAWNTGKGEKGLLKQVVFLQDFCYLLQLFLKIYDIKLILLQMEIIKDI